MDEKPVPFEMKTISSNKSDNEFASINEIQNRDFQYLSYIYGH